MFTEGNIVLVENANVSFPAIVVECLRGGLLYVKSLRTGSSYTVSEGDCEFYS